jgi:dolichol kinase
VTVIALAGMLVESLPLKDVDNITVTLVAVALGYLFFR